MPFNFVMERFGRSDLFSLVSMMITVSRLQRVRDLRAVRLLVCSS
jgi:hypothetical protein